MRSIVYVACSRGREDVGVFVEPVADLSQIQNRSGDGNAAVEMALGNAQGARVQAKELFRQLQRSRAVKAEIAEPAPVVTLCRQAAEALEPGKDQNRAADLQEHAIGSAQEAARTREALGGER